MRLRSSRKLAAFVFLCASTARAYRPFDGTDADVAKRGEFELELGPTQYFVRGEQRYLVVPATVFNFGLGARTELVVDFQNWVTLEPPAGAPRFRILGTDVLLKHVFREGTLQGATGVSVAAEGGLLTPDVNGVNGFGASLNVIASYQWWFGAVHLDEMGQFTRARNLDVFSGVILEGPHEWRVRPVTELFYEREFNVARTWSALAGAIWTVQDSFALDVGFRHALIANDVARELRLGFTWTVAM